MSGLTCCAVVICACASCVRRVATSGQPLSWHNSTEWVSYGFL